MARKKKTKEEDLEMIRTRSGYVFFGDSKKIIELDDLRLYPFGYPAEETDTDYELYEKLYDLYGRPPSAEEYATVSPRLVVPDLRLIKPGLEIVAKDSFFDDWGRKYYHFVDEYGLDSRSGVGYSGRTTRMMRTREISQWIDKNLSRYKRKGTEVYGNQLVKMINKVMVNPDSMLDVEVLTEGEAVRREFSSIDFSDAASKEVYIDIEPIFAARYILGILATNDSKYVLPILSDTEKVIYPLN